MSFPRYERYKDSGVEWLGEVPEHWQAKRLQDVSSHQKYSLVDGPFGSDLKNEEYTDDGVPLIQLNNIYNSKHVLNATRFISEEKANALIRHNAFPNDIVIAKMADPVARAAMVLEAYPRYVIVADCIRLAVNKNQYSVQFLVYTINCPFFRASAEVLSSGITRQRINLGSIKKIQFASPSLSEQTTIAAFLDCETAKIDNLINEQKKLIDLLKEKRQAVISTAVTKGLNPHAPMKDSGVEWLGEVPQGWDVIAIKRICDVRDGTHDTPLFVELAENTYPLITSKDLNSLNICFDEAKQISESDYIEISKRSAVSAGDILMPMIGSIGGAVLVRSETKFAIKNIALFKHALKFQVKWLLYILNSDLSTIQFTIQRSGGVQGFVALGTLRNLTIPFPPPQEQTTIVAFLDQETAKIDNLIQQAQKAATLLQERRTALISAAVTGKIDVRGFVTTNTTANCVGK